MNFRKFRKKIKYFLKQGLSPKDLALCLALTVYISIFPVLGTTTALLVLAMVKLKLNLPLAMSVSYLLTPVQLVGIIPFIRIGEFMVGAKPYPIDLDQLNTTFSSGILELITEFSSRLAMGVIGWFIVATPLCLGLYLLFFQAARWKQLGRIKSTVEDYEGSG
ncbi:DUF2062 domain-containing protein [Arthrospiribacter ruber]|uniref:DUF2062 domain-containing protein n=1 Tax=Arthrospiribacter ruber TaxID=2487934 RepID=A0A951J1D1_9BACT|nr:DUF2062 domain-containing protein [Arthrospiribacter ruber]MBW3469687.1 DUF2062 domain-containing protein [Arthrospiribacter ruber]